MSHQSPNQSLTQIETILEGIADGVMVQRPDGSLVYANETAAKLIGYASAAELLRAPLEQLTARFDLFDEAGRPLAPEDMPGRTALQGKEPDEMIVRFRDCATGVEEWSLVKARPIFDEQNQVQFAVITFRIVTEERRALTAERAARAEAEAARQRLTFLVGASEVLAQSLDYAATLQQVAELAVPHFADWCGVDLLRDNGRAESVAVIHPDPDRVELARELFRRYPSDPNTRVGLYRALQSGEIEIQPNITDEMLVAVAQDEGHLALLRALELRSLLIVPLKAGDSVLGALTLAMSESGRLFDEQDIAMAAELARRGAQAVEKAYLYHHAAQSNAELEQRVAERTAQLEVNIAELEEARTRFRGLLESAPDAMVIVSDDGIIKLVNSETENLFGYDRAELLGQPVELLVPERLRGRHGAQRGAYQDAPRRRGMGVGLELYGRRRDGRQVPVEISLSPLTINDEKVVIAAVRDITARKQSQEELRESQALYQALADNIPNGVVLVVDQELRYRLARGPGLSASPFAGEQLEGRYIWEGLPAKVVERRLKRYRDALAGIASTEEALYEGRTHLVQTVPLRNEQGEIYAALALAQDISDRKEAEETVRAMLQLSAKLNATLDLNEVLDTLAEEAMTLTGAESGFTGLVVDGGILIRKYHHKGMLVSLNELFPPGRGIPGWIQAHKEPYLTNDPAQDPHTVPEFLARFEINAVLSTPILDGKGQVLAMLEVNNKEGGGGFTANDQHRLMGLAEIAAIAIRNAKSYEAQRRLSQRVLAVQEEERARLSRELHDSAGQLLTALAIQLGLLASRPSQDEIRQEVLDIKELATQIQDEIRTLSHQLRPQVLDMADLDDALQEFCRDFARRTGLTIHYEGEHLPTLSEQASLAYYRFVQETLTNVAKHAQAQSVRVTLHRDENEIILTVEDDGRGFSANARASSALQDGVGLLGLQERFSLLDGRIEVQSTPGRGTRISARTRIDYEPDYVNSEVPDESENPHDQT